MIGIILTGHGAFPTAIYESVQLIAGEMERIELIPFNEDPEKLRHQLEEAMKKVDTGSGVVFFTDLAGGTPFNVSSKIAAVTENTHVIGGTNTPMLLSSVFLREMELTAFVQKVLEDGKKGVKQFEMKVKETEDDSDGI